MHGSRFFSRAGAWAVLFILSGSFTSLFAAAIPIQIDVAKGPAGLGPFAVTLRAVAEPASEAPRTREWRLEAPWSGTIDLEANAHWLVSVEAEGFWAPKLDFHPPDVRDEPFEIRLLPTGQATGRLLGHPSQLPDQVTLTFEAAPDPSAPGSTIVEKLVPKTLSTCPVEPDGSLRCTVPAGVVLDLKIQPAGFIPHYLWSLEVEPAQSLDLGSFELRAGASLAGWVSVPEASEDRGAASVELSPRVLGWQGNPKEGQRTKRRNLSTRTSDRGFFQLGSIPPGGYVLTASHPGFAEAVVPEIDVVEDEEIFLEEPLVLEPLGTLEALIDPPVDPRGRPWILRLLLRQRAATNLSRTVEESAASTEGQWRREGLQHGSYVLQVSDVDGSSWLREDVEVHADPKTIFLTAPVVPVEGHVSMGDESIEATLVFGSTQGSERIRLQSDEEGDFEGYLPREGVWPIDLVFDEEDGQAMAIEPVEVERSSGQRVARLDIELPDTRLQGRVVARGEPVPEAFIAIVREGEEGEKKSRQAVFASDEEGEFEIFGFPPGSLLVHGYLGQRSSPWLRVDIQEGLETPVLVVELTEKIELGGQVLFGSDGVPGVQLLAYPTVTDASSFALTAKAFSNADGSFSLSLPSSTIAMDLLVIPPGFAAHWGRWPVGAGSVPPIIQLTAEIGRLQVGPAGATGDGFLLFEGSSMPLSLLRTTMLPLGRVAFDGEGFVFEKMKPGNYSYCLGDQCNSGYLSPSGELLLTLP